MPPHFSVAQPRGIKADFEYDVTNAIDHDIFQPNQF
jgi:hypothetical protein